MSRCLLVTMSLFSTPVSLFLPCICIHLCYFLDSTYKWYHTVFVFLCLTYFTKHNILQFHPHYCKWQNFILFNGWVIFQCVYTRNQSLLIFNQYFFRVWSASRCMRDHSYLLGLSCGGADSLKNVTKASDVQKRKVTFRPKAQNEHTISGGLQNWSPLRYIFRGDFWLRSFLSDVTTYYWGGIFFRGEWASFKGRRRHTTRTPFS